MLVVTRFVLFYVLIYFVRVSFSLPPQTITLVPQCGFSGYIDNSGESFTCPRTEDLLSYAYYLEGSSGWSTGVYGTLTNGGNWGGTNLGTTPTVPFAANQAGGWVSFTFPSPPPKITQGSQYIAAVIPGTGWNYTPYPGQCGDVYSGGQAFLQRSAYSPVDYSFQITISVHCGNGVYDPTYDEVCDGGTACSSDCRSCAAGYQPAGSINCAQIDTCATYQCVASPNTIATTCSQPAVNQRICSCPPGYSTTSSLSTVNGVTITGNAAFGPPGCYDIDECSLYQCTSLSCHDLC